MLADLDQPLGHAAADAEGKVVQRARGDHAGQRDAVGIIGDFGLLGTDQHRQLRRRRRVLALAAGNESGERGYGEDGGDGTQLEREACRLESRRDRSSCFHGQGTPGTGRHLDVTQYHYQAGYRAARNLK